MSRAYFITGTDTGVGKSYIAAKFLESLSGDHGNLGYIKPFQTGCIRDCGDRSVAPDPEYVKEHLGGKVECSVLHRFELPACPLHAAEAEGKEIDFDAACEWVISEAGRFDVSVIEGAGGLLVPITREKTLLDMMDVLGFPVILVAANRLGCINHTLLSIHAMAHRGINIEAVILNRTESGTPDAVERMNSRMIGEFAPEVRIIETAYNTGFEL